MKNKLFLFPTILLLVIVISISFAADTHPNNEPEADTARLSEANASAPASEAFDKMMSVIAHKRCVNCHPAGDRPRQGEDSHIHNFNVLRGKENHGMPAYKCSTCHRDENNEYAGVPGAPEWGLAPIEMAWEGLSKVEIARSMMNPANNGGRSLEETVKHLTEHELVLWAFEPGINNEGIPREKPPISKEEYIAAVKEWAAAGAIIPDN